MNPSAKRLTFAKLHGLGNDFLVVDHRDLPGELSPALVRALCDRHQGVGADGVLVVRPPTRADAALQMEVHNADGSRAETCGNGIRCVAWWASHRWPAVSQQDTFVVETGAGPVRVTLAPDGGSGGEVRVEMGPASLAAEALPAAAGEGGPLVEEPLEVSGRTVRFTGVSMGNPHAVLWDPVEPADAAALGPALERHTAFPQGVNVGFARLSDDGVVLKVWERGCGFTQACGTGACAAVASGVVTGRLPAGREVPVDLPGGRLRVEVAADLSQVWMTGPVRWVFDGAVDLAALPGGGAP